MYRFTFFDLPQWSKRGFPHLRKDLPPNFAFNIKQNRTNCYFYSPPWNQQNTVGFIFVKFQGYWSDLTNKIPKSNIMLAKSN